MSDISGIADIATGGLVAREVDRAASGAAGVHAGGHEMDGAGGVCADCGTLRVGGFCHACGQSGHVHRNVTALGHDIAHGVFHFEGKIWKTLPLLVLRPGELTRRYVHGQRTRFVSPMALFLFSVFLLFATVNRVAMPDMAGVGQGLAKAKDEVSKDAGKAQEKLAELKEARGDELASDPKADVAKLDRQIADAAEEASSLNEAVNHLPTTAADAARIGQVKAGNRNYNFNLAKDVRGMNVNTGSSSLDEKLGRIKENPDLYAYKLKMASYKYSWALIPISVPLIWLLFCFRRNVGLYDHAIFAIHSLSFMTLLVVILLVLYMLGLSQAILWLAFLFVPPIHMYRQLKGAYNLRAFGAFWRTCALLMMTSVAGSLFFAMLLILEAD
jgi:hypothetical protein